MKTCTWVPVSAQGSLVALPMEHNGILSEEECKISSKFMKKRFSPESQIKGCFGFIS